jgi:hypothetical protein
MKTSVEWLQEQLECFGNKHELQMSWTTLDELFEQAKEMEKEQIEKAFDDGYAKSGITHNAQEYYEETFKSE